MTKEQEEFLKFTNGLSIEDAWRNFMKMATTKRHYTAKGHKDFTKVYKCEMYTCDAHPHGCFFCAHCTDIWVDPFSGPYMWACDTNSDTRKGVRGKCKHFKE